MKKYIIGSITVLIILCIILAIKLLSTGTRTQIMGATLIGLEVPKLSSIIDEEGEYVATFRSIRSVESLKKELDKMVLDYESCFDDGKVYYYNKKNNTTIIRYEVQRKFVVNDFIIEYRKGNACN